MTTVTVNASHSYPILIDRGLLSQTGPHLRSLGNFQKICIVSDSHVWPLFGKTVTDSLREAGFQSCCFVFPAGESSKNGLTYLELLDVLSREKLTRQDCIVALGGGVVGDLAGFAAATYLRGIPYVQLPTTLLAAVDSSVGGKTAIDLPAGKNLAGAFCQPRLVLCDLNALDSLPPEIFRDGCAEVIKYAMLYDPQLFARLEQRGLAFDREAVIARCVTLKSQVVAQDEFDTGERMKLNLGHTIGHGIEAASHYTISHGKAVAAGMAMMARAVQCPDATRLETLLEAFGLPTHTQFPPEVLLEAMVSDKKRCADHLNLIIPKAIGSCALVPTAIDSLPQLLKAGY